MIKKKGTESIVILTAGATKAIGKTENNMAKENLSVQKVSREKESGKMANEYIGVMKSIQIIQPEA